MTQKKKVTILACDNGFRGLDTPFDIILAGNKNILHGISSMLLMMRLKMYTYRV